MRRAVLGAVCGLCASACVGLVLSSAPPTANSFTPVYATIIAPTCSSAFCHNNGVSLRYGGLDMSSRGIAYWSLVDQPLVGPSCALMGTRVVPFHPGATIMYQKVSHAMPPCRSQMPPHTTPLFTH